MKLSQDAKDLVGITIAFSIITTVTMVTYTVIVYWILGG